MTDNGTPRTPNPDVQARQYELLTPRQLLTNEGDQSLPKQKKKCRGNRKAQRQRRKIRRTEEKTKSKDGPANLVDEDTANAVSQEGTSDEQAEEEEQQPHTMQGGSSEESQHQTPMTHKRKRDALTDNYRTGNLSQSLSRISISQEQVIKQPKLNGTDGDHDDEPLLNADSLQHTPGYLNTPDYTFVRMLAKSISNGEPIIQWLNNKEKISFVRQMAKLTNHIRYFDLQKRLWQDHYDLGLQEGWWGMELARSYARQHRICRAYSFTKNIIEERQRVAETGILRNTEALQKHRMQLDVDAPQWQPSIDPHLLSSAIDKFVHQGQKRLRDEFDYKKKMLNINATDHYLLRSFYWLQPNKEQVSSQRKKDRLFKKYLLSNVSSI